MKHTKKLIPAIGMLLLSACMLVTSTFAWFSMNESVTATNMSVKAKGDQVYLQIINPTSATESQKAFVNGAAQTSADATLQSSEILPVNVVNAIDTQDAKKVVAYKGDGTLVWVTNIGESTAVGTAKTVYSDVTSTANTTNGKYFLKNTFQIRLDPTAGATAASDPLEIASITTNTTADAFQACMNVLVVATYGTGETAKSFGQVWEFNGTNFVKKTGADALSDGAFTAANPATVDIYVFFNGDDADCTQEKLAAAKTTNYTVEVQFTVGGATQGA